MDRTTPLGRRKLLVATLGVATVSYVILANCGGQTDAPPTAANLPAPYPTAANLPSPPPPQPPPTAANLPAPPPFDAGADADASDASDASDAPDGE